MPRAWTQQRPARCAARARAQKEQAGEPLFTPAVSSWPEKEQAGDIFFFNFLSTGFSERIASLPLCVSIQKFGWKSVSNMPVFHIVKRWMPKSRRVQNIGKR